MVGQGKLKKGYRVGSAAFNGSTWYHRYKVLQPSGEIKYGKIQGFDSPEDANESYREYEIRFEAEARRQGLATRYDGKILFTEYLRYYLEEVLSPRCEASTRMVYSYTLYKHIIPNLKNDIAIDLINETYLNSLLEQVAPITKSAANKAREFIYLALKNAVTEYRIKDIPNMKAYPREKKPIQILNTDQIKVLLANANGTEWYLEILMGLFLGFRKGEILGIKFSDFSSENHSVSISRQLSSDTEIEDGGYKTVSTKRKEKSPKTDNSIRTLYVPDLVFEELEKRKIRVEADKARAGENYHDHGYVSCQKNGEPRGVSSLNNALSRICNKCGLPHISVHSLRHLYASILLEQCNYEIQIISALLGHSSIHTTFEYYTDIMDASEEIRAYQDDIYAIED